MLDLIAPVSLALCSFYGLVLGFFWLRFSFYGILFVFPPREIIGLMFGTKCFMHFVFFYSINVGLKKVGLNFTIFIVSPKTYYKCERELIPLSRFSTQPIIMSFSVQMVMS